MDAKQGFLILLASACLFANIATANDGNVNDKSDKNVPNISDLSQLSGAESPVAKDLLLNDGKFAGELRTSINPASEKVAISKSKTSKAMISKFRINGI